jgi:uncharacterized membrane protein YtjA (UPF0391 family)
VNTSSCMSLSTCGAGLNSNPIVCPVRYRYRSRAPRFARGMRKSCSKPVPKSTEVPAVDVPLQSHDRRQPLGSVGSTNFDSRSFSMNDEANLNVYDADFARRQSQVFDEDLRRSRRVTYEEWENRAWQEKLIEHASGLLSSQLQFMNRSPSCPRIPSALTSLQRGDFQSTVLWKSHYRNTTSSRRKSMFYWAAVFLIIALVAAVLGFSGIAGTSANIAWILFVVGLIVAVVFLVLGRRP